MRLNLGSPNYVNLGGEIPLKKMLTRAGVFRPFPLPETDPYIHHTHDHIIMWRAVIDRAVLDLYTEKDEVRWWETWYWFSNKTGEFETVARYAALDFPFIATCLPRVINCLNKETNSFLSLPKTEIYH